MSRLPRGTRFRNKQERAEYFLLDERRLRQAKVTDFDCKLWEKVIQFSDFFEDIKSFDLDLRMNYPLGTVFGYGMADQSN